MSKLTDFLHRLVDAVGVSSLHGAIDELETETNPTETETESDAAE